MHPFSYTVARDTADAIRAHAGAPGARFIAGGTTLVDLMKLAVETPAHLVDISRLPLTAIEPRDGGVRIGALASNTAVAEHPVVRARYPLIAQSILLGATQQIRNVATVGGNLLQRTRCLYFRDPSFPCNKREPGSGCPAIAGVNRTCAVLGTSDACIAAHASDLCVALAAIDATVEIEGPTGRRQVPIVDLYRLPGDAPERETVLEGGELITAVGVPALPFATRSAYLKVRDRTSYAFATVSVAAALDVRDGLIHDARLALGGVGTRPWRVTRAEAVLRGQPAGESAYGCAAEEAVRGARGYAGNAFKVELARRAVVRVLTALERPR